MFGFRVVGLAAALTISATAVLFQVGSVLAQPEITESNVQNGDVLDSPPGLFHLCFSEPVDTSDQPTPGPGGEQDSPWAFNVTDPNGTSLGLRIVFQPDGGCVDVEPGLAEDPPDGVWLFEWLVRSQETGDEASGVISFRVGSGDPPVSVDAESNGSNTTLYVVIGVAVVVGLAAIGAAVVGVRRWQAGARSKRV